ncbi:hypothetical protein BX600DRAFT_438078 [Xylariales sp. PMI_506]|nr:hypothetical protein BX600DRAFT_438078 [Xylariales sp. PMI_506]
MTFTCGIADAAAAVVAAGDTAFVGDKLYQAFIDLEYTLAPGACSRFTVGRPLFTPAVLNQGRTVPDAQVGRKSHPFPSGLHAAELRRIVVDLDVAEKPLALVCLVVWTAYHWAITPDNTKEFAHNARDRQWWRFIVRLSQMLHPRCRQKSMAGTRSTRPVFHFLIKFSSYAEGDPATHEDSELVNVDKVSSVYFYSSNEDFTNVALNANC